MVNIKIKNQVELGHSKFIGGSTDICIEYYTDENNFIYRKNAINLLLNIIDNLDHCMLIYDEKAEKFYERYFVLDKDLSGDFYYDTACVIFKMLIDNHSNPKNFKVSICKDGIEETFDYCDVDEEMVISTSFKVEK